MHGALVETGEKRPRGRRDDRQLVVLTGEGPDGVQRVEERQGHELDLVACSAPKEVRPVETLDPVDARKDFGAEERLVGVSIPGWVQPCQRRRIIAQ